MEGGTEGESKDRGRGFSGHKSEVQENNIRGTELMREKEGEKGIRDMIQ